MKTSRRGIGKITKVGIVIVVVIVALFVIGAVTPPKATNSSQTSTTTIPTNQGSAPTQTSSSPTTTSTIQSSSVVTQTSQTSSASSTSASSTSSSTTSSTISTTSSPGPLAIVISQTSSDPPEAQTGNSIFIYNVAFTNNGQSSYSVDELFFTMITVSNSVYNVAFVFAIQQNLPSVTLNPGQKTSGQIAFQIPSTETPAELEYNVPDSIDEFVTNLPMPSSSVSEPNIEITTNVQGTTNAYGSQDLSAFSSIQNNTFYFYTGQIIAIKVALTDVDSGTTVTVNSIASNTTGLSLNQITPSLPVMVTGSGNEVDEMVYILAPPTSFSGTITIDVTGSG
jgi:hypothetical protein